MKNWTKEDEQYLRDNYLTMTQPELAAVLGTTTLGIKCRCRVLDLKLSNAERGKRAAQGRKDKRKDEDILFDTYVAANYLLMPLKTICRNTGFSMTKVYSSLKLQGLKVPDDLIEQRRGIGAFKEGAIPPNKGKKIEEYMSPAAVDKVRKSHFEKGHRPHNAHLVGDEVIVEGYTRIKVSEPNVWVFKQVLIYEAHHGKLPKGKIVIFIDKNKQNFDISNLKAITRGEHARRNHDIEKSALFSRELRDTYVAGVLKRKTGLDFADIPDELIKIKRAELQIKRELNHIQKSKKNESK